MIKAVIFDFGGVVIDVSQTGSVELITRTLGVNLASARSIIGKQIERWSVGEIGEEEFWQKICQDLGKPIPENWKELWRKPTEENAILFPETINLAKELKEKGIKALVLSNTLPPHIEVISKKGWYDFFDKLYFSCEIGFRKPDIKAYEYVLEKESLLGSECVFVDDSEDNLIPARNLGMKVVWAQSPNQVREEVSRLIL